MKKKTYFFLLLILIVRIFLYAKSDLTGNKIVIRSRVLREPSIYDTSQLIRLQDYRAYVDKYPEIYYGDIVELAGIVNGKKIEGAQVVKVLRSNNLLFTLRKKLISNYLNFLPLPHSAIVAGVTLGSQGSIPEELWDNLTRTGTAHIVVASGTNVTYTAVFLLAILLTFLNRRKALQITFVGVWLYVAMSGFDPPLVRAAIMGSIVFFGQIFGRVINTLNILFVSIFLMLLFSPSYIYEIGFWLSSLATFSLIVLEPKIYPLLSIIPEIIRKDFSTTLSAQIAVTPIILYTFKQFNILSPIYNVLILWTVPPIMILGAISGLLGLLSPFLGHASSLLIYPFTSWFIFVTSH